jgi:hypothetical protein
MGLHRELFKKPQAFSSFIAQGRSMYTDCPLLNSLDQNLQGEKEDVNVIEGMGNTS